MNTLTHQSLLMAGKTSSLMSLLVVGIWASSSALGAEAFPAKGDFAKGSAVWAENCSRCHNMRGPDELRDDQWISTVFHMRLRAGLTGQETRDVLTFLQSSNHQPALSEAKDAGKAPVAASATLSGGEVFNQTCISCHGSDGTGAFPGVPDFTEKGGVLSKPKDVLIDHISNGFQSPGSPMAMPAKGGNPALGRADIEAVLDYLKEKFAP